MQLKAKLTQLLPLQTGMGKNGQWRKQDIIVETDSQYPKKICVSIWGDKINETQLIVGNVLDISYELESHEFNNKWYTDVKSWKIETANTKVPLAVNSEPINSEPLDEIEDDLPF
jgi:hypothetical protein